MNFFSEKEFNDLEHFVDGNFCLRSSFEFILVTKRRRSFEENVAKSRRCEIRRKMREVSEV